MGGDYLSEQIKIDVVVSTLDANGKIKDITKRLEEMRDAVQKASKEGLNIKVDDTIKSIDDVNKAIGAMELQKAKEISSLEKKYGDLAKSIEDCFKAERPLAMLSFVKKQREITELAKRYEELTGKAIEAATAIKNPIKEFNSFDAYKKSLAPMRSLHEELAELSRSSEKLFRMGDMNGLEQIKKQMKILKSEQRAYNKEMSNSSTYLGSFAQKFRSHFNWILAGGVIGTLGAIPALIQNIAVETEALGYKIKQNLELTEQYHGNMSKLDEDMSHLNEVAQVYAMGYGTSVSNVMEMMQVLSRRFKTKEELTYYTNLALVMHKLDFVAPQKAAEDLEAVILSMGLDFKQAKEFIDQFSVAVHTARINGTELLTGLQRSGSTFKTMNFNTAQAIAMISTLSTVTAKAGANIGASLNSILINTNFPKAEKYLNAYGVKVYEVIDGHKKMRDGVDIWRDIIKVFNGLQDEDKANKFADAISGGKFRASDLRALLTNWQTFEKIYSDIIEKASPEMTASLLKTGLESTQNKIQELKASLEVLGIVIGENTLPALKELVMGLSNGVQWLNENKESVKNVVDWVWKFVVALAELKIAQKLMNPQLGKFLSVLLNIIRDSSKFTTAMKSMETSIKNFGNAAKVAFGKFILLHMALEGIQAIYKDYNRENSEKKFLTKFRNKYDPNMIAHGEISDKAELEIYKLIQERDAIKEGLTNPKSTYLKGISKLEGWDKFAEANEKIDAALQEYFFNDKMKDINKMFEEANNKVSKIPKDPTTVYDIVDGVDVGGRGKGGKPNTRTPYEQSNIDYTDPINKILHDAAERHGVDEALVRAIASVESNFNPNAVSSAGAQGLMQLMPETARGLGVKDSFDAADNADGGVRYLKEMLSTFGGDITKAVAAYNAGPQAVKNYKGIPPYAETQDYVKKVKEAYEAEKKNVGYSHFNMEKWEVDKDKMEAHKLFTASEIAAKQYEATLKTLNTQEDIYGKTAKSNVATMELMLARRKSLNDQEWVFTEMSKRKQAELDKEIEKNSVVTDILREQGLEWKNLTKEEQNNLVDSSKLSDAQQKKIKTLSYLVDQYAKKAQEMKSKRIEIDNEMLKTNFSGVFDKEKIYQRRMDEIAYNEKMQKDAIAGREYDPTYNEQIRQIELAALYERRIAQEQRLKELEAERAELQKGLPVLIEQANNKVIASEKRYEAIKRISIETDRVYKEKEEELARAREELASTTNDEERAVLTERIAQLEKDLAAAYDSVAAAAKEAESAESDLMQNRQLRDAAESGNTKDALEIEDAIRKTESAIGDTIKKIDETKDKFKDVRSAGADVFSDLIVQGTSFKDVWKRLWNDLANDAIRALFRVQAQGLFAKVLGIAFGGGGKTSGINASYNWAGAASTGIGLFGGKTKHDGGAITADLPKMHDGGLVLEKPTLKDDEVTRTLQVGERVLSKEDNKRFEGFMPRLMELAKKGPTMVPAFSPEIMAQTRAVMADSQQTKAQIAELQRSNELLTGIMQAMMAKEENNGGNVVVLNSTDVAQVIQMVPQGLGQAVMQYMHGQGTLGRGNFRA